MPVEQKHRVLIAPGLGDNTWLTQQAVRHFWKDSDLSPSVINPRWVDASESFKEKLARFSGYIERYHTEGDLVSLVGISAGGSLVVNLLARHPDMIHRVVNIGGRMREGPKDWRTTPFRTLETAASSSASFADSIKVCEEAQGRLSPDLLQRILVIRPLLDQVVPRSTNNLPGANNRYFPWAEHVSTSVLVMTLGNKIIRDFLKRR